MGARPGEIGEGGLRVDPWRNLRNGLAKEGLQQPRVAPGAGSIEVHEAESSELAVEMLVNHALSSRAFESEIKHGGAGS